MEISSSAATLFQSIYHHLESVVVLIEALNRWRLTAFKSNCLMIAKRNLGVGPSVSRTLLLWPMVETLICTRRGKTGVVEGV